MAQQHDAEDGSLSPKEKYRRIAEHRRYPKKNRYTFEDLVIGGLAMDAGVNRYYAMHAGKQARRALDYLGQAAQATDRKAKTKAIRLARKYLGEVSRQRHPELADQIEARILWEEGWRPETWDAERNTPRGQGPSINPETGAQEFFTASSPLGFGITTPFDRAAYLAKHMNPQSGQPYPAAFPSAVPRQGPYDPHAGSDTDPKIQMPLPNADRDKGMERDGEAQCSPSDKALLTKLRYEVAALAGEENKKREDLFAIVLEIKGTTDPVTLKALRIKEEELRSELNAIAIEKKKKDFEKVRLEKKCSDLSI